MSENLITASLNQKFATSFKKTSACSSNLLKRYRMYGEYSC